MKAKTKLQADKHVHVLFTGLVTKDVLSGGDQLFFDIAPRLPKNIHLTVIMPEFAMKHWVDIDTSNIEFKLLPRTRFDLNSNPVMIFLSYVVRAWQVNKLLRDEKRVETIYSCSDIAYADIWPAYLAVGRNPATRWVSRVYHVLLPPQRRQGSYAVNVVAFLLQRLSFRMMKRRSSTVLALNEKLRGELLDLQFTPQRLGILGAGIDFTTINSHTPTKAYPYDIVVMGRIAPVKGMYDVIEAWKIIHASKPELKLGWIGYGGEIYQQKMEKLIEKNGFGDSITLLGFIDKDKAYDILHTSKLFLCPDHENGWGLAVCEAMASGLPVVSYDLDIFGGVYKKGYKSVKLFDSEAYAHAILSLINNDQARGKMAKDAVQQAHEFDHEQVIKSLVKYLR